MLQVNNLLFNPTNIYNFIDASINKLIITKPNLVEEKEYWLFYFIKSDFFSNWMSLYNVNIDQDFLGFPLIRKNTRHAIESFLDLFNLIHDKEYMIVLEYCSKRHKRTGKYKNYLYNGHFSIQSKNNIAKTYGEDFQNLLDTYRESNDYVHPNVFIEVLLIAERDKKQEILRKLLNINLYLLVLSYQLILKKYSNNEQPYLGCCVYNNCNLCYNNAYNNFKNCVENQLLINNYPNPISFQ